MCRDERLEDYLLIPNVSEMGSGIRWVGNSGSGAAIEGNFERGKCKKGNGDNGDKSVWYEEGVYEQGLKDEYEIVRRRVYENAEEDWLAINSTSEIPLVRYFIYMPWRQIDKTHNL